MSAVDVLSVRQNFHPDTEVDINKLVNMKLTASYTYLSLGMYFDRDDVALANFSSFFLKQSKKERQQADQLLHYQNLRGGRILLQTVPKPSRDDWSGGVDALSFSLEVQKSLNTAILEVHLNARTNADPHLCDFLDHFLEESHEVIKRLGDHVGSLTRLTTASGPHGDMGEYLFDKHTL